MNFGILFYSTIDEMFQDKPGHELAQNGAMDPYGYIPLLLPSINHYYPIIIPYIFPAFFHINVPFQPRSLAVRSLEVPAWN